MADNLASSILAARSRTRVNALLFYARLILCAFGADYTFGSAIWCTANVANQTRTYGMTVCNTTLTVQTALWRIAWVYWLIFYCEWSRILLDFLVLIEVSRQPFGSKRDLEEFYYYINIIPIYLSLLRLVSAELGKPKVSKRLLTAWWWRFVAGLPWIAGQTGQTCATRCMIKHLTLGVLSTNTGTRVSAFIVWTRLVSSAVIVRHTFWSTTAIWIAEIVGQAGTWPGSVTLFAHSIRAAWWRGARLSRWFIEYGCGQWIPTCKTALIRLITQIY